MKRSFIGAACLCAAMLTSCGNKEGLTMGSLSEFDSLSYALGANMGYGLNYEMSDVPFDFKAVDEGIKDGAFDKAKQEHDAAIEQLRDYFMNKRPARMKAIAEKYAADSTLTPVKADPDMFATEGERDSVSYAFGQDIGFNIKESDMPIKVAWILEAMQNVRDNNAKMDEAAASDYLQYFFMVKRPAQNAEASKAWLEKIEKKSGVQKSESGLLYKVVKMGDETVMATDQRDMVKVHYTGRTRDGKVFDSSIFKNRPKEQQEQLKKYRPDDYDKDEPIEFALNRVIPGWTEGMQKVGKGGKIMLWIPAELAYGTRGAGNDIGPNEALEFEVELIDVTPYEEPAPAAPAEEAADAAETEETAETPIE